MNNGLYGFPSSTYGSSVIEVKEFDSSGTYEIPNGAKRLWIMLIGGGGGGGSGARQASGTQSYGGGGGAGGTQNTGYYFVNAIGSTSESNAAGNAGFTPGAWGRTLTIVIGSGGTGGASASSDTSSGSNGVAGGASTITLTGTPGFMMYSSGGAAGGAGTGASGGTGGTGQQRLQNGMPRTATYLTSGAAGSFVNGSNIAVSQYVNTGGAGGGGLQTSNTPSVGGGIQTLFSTTVPYIVDPAMQTGFGVDIKSGGLVSTATSQPFIPATLGNMKYTPGLGGAGGGASATTAANNGTDGYRGGGGGGGGASRNTFASGAGGNGGNGYCVIIALGL